MRTTVENDKPRNRVCVWFGEHLIAEYTAEPDAAARYEAAMGRRFLSLRVTNEPAVNPDVERR
ncbi:hypothetical protein ACXJJ3_33465 [Kribbella sp. WER1]